MQPVDDRGRMVEKLLGGRYEAFGFLGKGGFASVYQVRSVSLQRFEALKVLHESHGEDSDFARRFRQEARVAASLEHPNIVKIYDFGHVEGTLWYSMQFVEGPTLSEELKTRKTFDEESAARIGVPLLDALDYSHARGVVHRDIKPDNVLLDKRDRPFLMDFGIAKTGESLVKTQTGFILGSPAYLSPEQLRGQPLDGRTDVYSLGVTLYQMLAGTIPYRTENMSALARRLTEEAPRLSGWREGIHPELERIVHRSLERDRDARYANAAEMRDDLDAFLAEFHPKTTRVRTISSESPSLRRRPEPPPRVETRAVPAPGAAHPPPEPDRPLPAAPPSRGTPVWVWPAVAAALAAALVAVWFAGRMETFRPAPANLTPPVSTSVSTLVPTPLPTIVPTSHPAALPSAVPTFRPTAVPTPVPTRASTRVPAAVRTQPPQKTAPVQEGFRRAKTQPDVLEETMISLTPSQERECSGKVVGVSLVVGEDGSLRGKHVISADSPTCDAIALDAVSRNRYKPALDERGSPVEGRFLVSIRF